MKTKPDKPIWVADCETDPFLHGRLPEPFIWGIYHGYDDGLYREFTGTGPAFVCGPDDLRILMDFLREQEIIIYAHNGGKFDWHFLSPYFEPDSKLLVIHGRLSRFTIGKCEFRDSFNLMPVALEQYNKMKFDYTKMEREHRAEHMDEIRTYLKSDCVNLWNMVHGFVESYGMHITQASAAMHFWQHKLKNPVPRSGPALYDKIKPYYFGGRVQCFEQGDFKIKAKSIDINSAYPYAMLSEHPYSIHHATVEGVPRKVQSKWGPLFFTVECVAHGCFPYRALNDSLYFPDDDITRIYDVTGWELLAALETDTVSELKIISHMAFNENRNFSEYVNHFWNLRKHFKAEGDKGGDFYAKIFLNALYGKFASDPRRFNIYTLKRGSELKNVIDNLGDHDTFRHFREWLIVVENIGGHGKGRFYNLATAASITGFVRAMLWRAIQKAKRPLYCDTDSIMAVDFSDDIVLSENLGDWEVENEYDRVIMGGKKLYAFHKAGQSMNQPGAWKVASKGARLTPNDLIRIAAGDTVTYKNIAPTFSAAKSKPTFIDRDIKSTATDIRFVPRRYDPMFKELDE